MTVNRVALYSRVSTHHGQDPDLQLRELREYTASRGLTIVQEYTDVGFSGSKDSRPALNQLIRIPVKRAKACDGGGHELR
jgi:DNA invertase Pin-like site-specific DNA recombinase